VVELGQMPMASQGGESFSSRGEATAQCPRKTPKAIVQKKISEQHPSGRTMVGTERDKHEKGAQGFKGER